MVRFERVVGVSADEPDAGLTAGSVDAQVHPGAAAAIRRHPRLVAVAVVVATVVAAVGVRLFVVPASDRAGPTDAIVVLGGDTFHARLRAAYAQLQRFPGEVLVVSIPGTNRCPRQPASVSLMICFRPDPSTTQGEAREVARLARENGWTSVTVVTTADQVWRARLRFSRCWSGRLSVVQAPTSMLVRLRSVPHESAATVKAEVFQRGC